MLNRESITKDPTFKGNFQAHYGEKNDYKGIFSLVIGRGSVIGERLINDKRVPLISATGSTKMGKRIGQVVGGRLGKSILELGGNNAIIVDETANMDMVVPAILFGAVGTAGQRCTSTRRIIVKNSIYDILVDKLKNALILWQTRPTVMLAEIISDCSYLISKFTNVDCFW